MMNQKKLELQLLGIYARAKAEKGQNLGECMGCATQTLLNMKSRGELRRIDFWKICEMADIAGMKVVFEEK